MRCQVFAPTDDLSPVAEAIGVLGKPSPLIAASTHMHRALLSSGHLLFPDIRWLLVQDSQGPAAVIPVRCRVERDGPLAVMSLASLDRFEMLYADALVRTNVEPDTVAPWLLTAAVAHGRRADVVRLRNLPESSALRKMARALRGQIANVEGTSVIDVAQGGDHWLAQCGRNLRGQIRQSENRLRQRGDIALRSPHTPEEFGAALERFIALEVAGYKSVRNALANEPGDRAVLVALVRGHAERGTAHLLELYVDETLVASQFGVVCEGRLYLIKIAFNEAFADASPGTFLMASLLKQAGAVEGFSCVDCCVRQPWHARWHPNIEMQGHATIPNRGTPRGLVLYAARTARAAFQNSLQDKSTVS